MGSLVWKTGEDNWREGGAGCQIRGGEKTREGEKRGSEGKWEGNEKRCGKSKGRKEKRGKERRKRNSKYFQRFLLNKNSHNNSIIFKKISTLNPLESKSGL